MNGAGMSTVLLVEDDFLNRRLCKKVLTESGFLVLEAKNAPEAMEILRKTAADLVVLDINLGENQEDGITLGQQIREKYAVPFIYLTAYDVPGIVSKAVATTPYSYLTKPFKNVDLIASVEIAIRQSADSNKYRPSILVKDEDYHLELPVDQINYVESDGNYLLLHTDKKIYRSRSTLRQLLEILPGNTFVQVHRAYVINKTRIEKFNQKHVIVGSAEIPVSRNYLDGISTLL